MHQTPQIALLQAIVSLNLFAFCLWHSWKFDRLATLKLWRCRSRGQAFQAAMLMFYFIGLPLFATQGVVFAHLKYKYGFLPVSMTGNPVPHQFWSAADQRYIPAVNYLDSLAWAANLFCHFEELCYWLYLIRVTSSSRPFFRSSFFLAFVTLSVASLVVLLAVTILWASANPLKLEAVVYFVGSTLTLLINFGFFYVNLLFPKFLKKWKDQGVSSDLIVRLASFHSINQMRLGFVFCFCLPLIILSADGLTESHVINKQVVWVDAVLQIGLLGFAGQAICTFMIFQPRNMRAEAGYGRDVSLGGLASPSFSGSVTCSQNVLRISQSPPPAFSSSPPMAFEEKRPDSDPFKQSGPFTDLAPPLPHPYNVQPRDLEYSVSIPDLKRRFPLDGVPGPLRNHLSPIYLGRT